MRSRFTRGAADVQRRDLPAARAESARLKHGYPPRYQDWGAARSTARIVIVPTSRRHPRTPRRKARGRPQVQWSNGTPPVTRCPRISCETRHAHGRHRPARTWVRPRARDSPLFGITRQPSATYPGGLPRWRPATWDREVPVSPPAGPGRSGSHPGTGGGVRGGGARCSPRRRARPHSTGRGCPSGRPGRDHGDQGGGYPVCRLVHPRKRATVDPMGCIATR